MKRIPLTQGKYAIVDDKDYRWLNQWKWFAKKDRNTYYAARHTKETNRTILMHREILGLKSRDGKQTDHINHNGLDNRNAKLRICTNAQNQHNRQHQGTSKFKGVSWYKRDKKWCAQIRYNSKKIRIGCYKNKVEAAKAYDKKAKELFGEFARTNF